MGLSDLGVVKDIFGSGDAPGVMGTGQQRFDAPQMGQPKRDANGNPVVGDPVRRPGESDSDFNDRRERYFFEGGAENGDVVYETDPYKAWQDPQAEARRAQLNADKAKYENREAKSMTAAATNLNDLERTHGVNAFVERGQQAQLAPAERVGNQNIGQANVYGGAQVDPAAQARAAQLGRQDQQFRTGQTGLMGQLQEQAAGRGPSLAAGQLREATDRNLAQQSGAAAAGGGNAALARRQLATGAAQANQQAGRDAAQMRIQEQLAARQQLQGVAQTGREQDINVANAQAQLQQQTSLANQAALNSRSAQQAGLTQQAGLAGAESLNARQYQQAQMNQQSALANQAAGNQFALQQGQFGQQMNMSNMDASNRALLQNAQMQQQANLANQQYYNQGMFSNTGYQQQANQANLQAQLQNQQMNDAMARYMTEAGLGLDARQQEAMMAFQKQQQATALGYAGLEQKAYEGAREGIGGMMGGLGGMVGGLAMMSDEEVKESISKGNSSIGKFLDEYGSNESADVGTSVDTKVKTDNMFDGVSTGVATNMIGGLGGLTAMSDKKAKDLTAENTELKKQMEYQGLGNAMSQGGKGKGFLAGLGGGIASGAKANAAEAKAKSDEQMKASNAKDQADSYTGRMASDSLLKGAEPDPSSEMKASNAAKPDPSSEMVPIMNNPNMAISMPAGAMPPPPNSGNIIRENPYPAPPMQTWGVSPPEPVYTPPATMPAGMSNLSNPYGPPLQTWGSSDKTSKKEIRSAVEDEMADFLNQLHPYEYSYKDPELSGRGYGRFVSPMAQDLEKTDLGQSAVKETSQGKMVDYGKLGGVMLASQAYLNERLNELEGKKGKR